MEDNLGAICQGIDAKGSDEESVNQQYDAHDSSRFTPAKDAKMKIRKDLKPANIFPDFEIPDQDGEVTKLSELMGGWHRPRDISPGNGTLSQCLWQGLTDAYRVGRGVCPH